MNAPTPRSMFSELAKVIVPAGPKTLFERVLIDSSDYGDARLMGADAEVPHDEPGGLFVKLKVTEFRGFVRADLTTNGPDGEVEYVGIDAIRMLRDELTSAIAAVERSLARPNMIDGDMREGVGA